jgi:hypothetical protein
MKFGQPVDAGLRGFGRMLSDVRLDVMITGGLLAS